MPPLFPDGVTALPPGRMRTLTDTLCFALSIAAGAREDRSCATLSTPPQHALCPPPLLACVFLELGSYEENASYLLHTHSCMALPAAALAAAAGSSSARPLRILAFGDSLTAGWTSFSSGDTPGFAPHLQRALATHHQLAAEVTAAGAPGRAAAQSLPRSSKSSLPPRSMLSSSCSALTTCSHSLEAHRLRHPVRSMASSNICSRCTLPFAPVALRRSRCRSSTTP